MSLLALFGVWLLFAPSTLGYGDPAQVTAGVTETTAERQLSSVATRGQWLLRRAAAVEDASEHPIGRAIVAGARERGIDLPKVEDFQALAGHGVQGSVDGTTVYVGRNRMMAEAGIDVPDQITSSEARMEAQGRTVVMVGWDGQVQRAVQRVRASH